MKTEDEREHFAHWISTAVPFDSNVGMVEHSIKTDAAWLGWMACAASRDFQAAVSVEGALPEPAQVSYVTDSVGRNMQVRSYTAGQVRELLAAERLRAVKACESQRLTLEIGTNAEIAYGEGVENCVSAVRGA